MVMMVEIASTFRILILVLLIEDEEEVVLIY